MSVFSAFGNWISEKFYSTIRVVDPFSAPSRLMPVYPNPNATRFITEGYCGNASVYTILSKKAKKFAHIRRGVFEVQDSVAYKSYRNSLKDGFATQQNINRTLKLKTKALGSEAENDLSQLLDRPNEWQGQDSFFELLSIYYETTGEGFIWCNRGDTIGKSDDEVLDLPVLEMFVMPSQFIEIDPDPYDIYGVLGYWFNKGSERLRLRKVDVIHWKKPNPQFDETGRTHLRGLSPLQAGNKILTQDDDSTDAMVAMYQNGGPKAIIFDKSMKSMSPKQESQLDAVMDRKVNNNKIKAAVARVQGDWGILNLGANSVDMQLIDGQEKAFVRLCNLLDTPPALFVTDQTYENKLQSIRDWINNSLIPSACSLRDEMNRVLLRAFKLGDGYTIDIDPSDLPELQDDLGKMVTWLKDAWWLTPNQKLDYMNEPARPEPEFNEPWIPTGAVPMSQLSEDDGGAEILENLRKVKLNGELVNN